jgi:hypothetical protein
MNDLASFSIFPKVKPQSRAFDEREKERFDFGRAEIFVRGL